MESLTLRRACPADRPEILALQESALRRLGAGYYSGPEIEAFIAEIGTMDHHLIDDGHYLVATEQGRIVGTGGWSTRTPSYDRATGARPQLRSENATVRSVYVHPRWARRGIGGRLMAAIEAEISAQPFDQARLTATLSGLPLYERLGYVPTGQVTITLADGIGFRGVKMVKALSDAPAAPQVAA